MTSLPYRFREHLANVCYSHNVDTLDNHNEFPILARYGSHEQETANVQYAAILLRTVDLIHVTKDRTPSMTFKIIGFSDPVSIDEWKKQQTVFYATAKNKIFNKDDVDAHIILIGADFTEEKPYFALAEYIAYADNQIKQSKRWADKAQSVPDGNGKDYFFPWHSIQGDIRVEHNEPVPMRFELDRGRLLNLLVGHTIYNNPMVAIRELLQNAIDAVRYQYHLDVKNNLLTKGTLPVIGKVIVKWDSKKRTLAVIDNGVGMDLDTIKYHLMTVGSSFYDTPQFYAESTNFTPISRFGIGVLTCFMVSDDIEFITFKQDIGYRIRMTSVESNYLLKKLDVGSSELREFGKHGTKVTLKFRPSIDIEEDTILEILSYWIILPECEVYYVKDEKEHTSVGFSSVQEAVEYFYAQFEENDISNRSFSIKTETRHIGEATYDLAYTVVNSWTPEKSFSLSRNYKAPSVCIEGIRVDDKLPGFTTHGSSKIAGLLSVKGNREFRTTVSRADLEEDNEYVNVSKVCIDMLLNHIHSEVERISKSQGKPLSKASTGAKWLYDSVSRMCSPSLREYLYNAFLDIPLTVVETDNDEDVLGRIITTTRKIDELAYFWTIESRLVNYLGIISRDLGRELSIKEFMSKLAPGLFDHQIYPLVLEPDYIDSIITQKREVAIAQFSRANQQTTLKWVHSEKENLDLSKYTKMNTGYAMSHYMEKLNEYAGFKIFTSAREFQSLLSYVRPTYVADIKGDISEIDMVLTNICLVIKPGTKIAENFLSINKALAVSDNVSGEDKSVILFVYAIMLRQLLPVKKTNMYIESSNKVLTAYEWKLLASFFNNFMRRLRLDVLLSENLQEVFGNENCKFTASSYWMNWEKGSTMDEDYLLF